MSVPKSQTKWKKEHTTLIGVRLHNEYDADVIEYLNRFSSKQDEIRRLVREEIARNDNE